jgi:outer membrane protein, heavy metal efflux system
MRSEKGKARSEKNPLWRGNRLQSVQRSNQGCVDGVLSNGTVHSMNHASAEHTPRSLNRASRFRFRFPPLERGLSMVVVLLAAIFMGALTTSVHAQGSEPTTNQVNTPHNLPLLGENYPQLEEYIRIAIEENPELRSLHHLYEAEKERAREMGVLPDPELNIMYDFNPMMSESQLGRFSVSAMQMFPWFGTLNTRKEAQRSVAEADRARIDLRQLEILRDLQIAWFNIAEVRQQIQITEQNLELVRELERIVEIRYETGRAAQSDILRIQMEEQRLKNRIENLQDLLNPLKASFNEFLNRAPDTEVEIPDAIQQQPDVYTEEQIEELVKAQNPAFEVLEARGRSLEYQDRIAQLSGRPSFGLGVEVMGRDFGPMSMFPDASESVIGMATVRLPIFRSRTRSQQQQISERIRALDFDLHQTENRLAAEVETVLEQVRKSERNIVLLDEELIPRAQQALDILAEEYSVGRVRFDELLQIQRELLDLEIERIEAVVRQNKAVVRIESLIGNSPLLRGDR